MTTAVVPPTLESRRETPVGLPARIEGFVIEGAELEAVPADRDSPIVLRVTAVYTHGTAFRYDLEYYGLDPGEHDLAKSLRRKDGSSASASSNDISPIPVTIVSTLPPGIARPHRSAAAAVPTSGGYRTLLVLAGAVWAIGLAAILFLWRRKRLLSSGATGDGRPLTLAEKLRPLVLRASRGELAPKERAELELRLIAYWRKRLSLEEKSPEEALSILKRHESAGPLLKGLEDWLHRPSSPPREEVDLAALLEPYRDVTDESFEGALSSARGGA